MEKVQTVFLIFLSAVLDKCRIKQCSLLWPNLVCLLISGTQGKTWRRITPLGGGGVLQKSRRGKILGRRKSSPFWSRILWMGSKSYGSPKRSSRANGTTPSHGRSWWHGAGRHFCFILNKQEALTYYITFDWSANLQCWNYHKFMADRKENWFLNLQNERVNW